MTDDPHDEMIPGTTNDPNQVTNVYRRPNLPVNGKTALKAATNGGQPGTIYDPNQANRT